MLIHLDPEDLVDLHVSVVVELMRVMFERCRVRVARLLTHFFLLLRAHKPGWSTKGDGVFHLLLLVIDLFCDHFLHIFVTIFGVGLRSVFDCLGGLCKVSTFVNSVCKHIFEPSFPLSCSTVAVAASLSAMVWLQNWSRSNKCLRGGGLYAVSPPL